jgi:hypothetical protein
MLKLVHGESFTEKLCKGKLLDENDEKLPRLRKGSEGGLGTKIHNCDLQQSLLIPLIRCHDWVELFAPVYHWSLSPCLWAGAAGKEVENLTERSHIERL